MKKIGAVFHNQSSNVGDEIQTLAAVKLLPRVDYFLDREFLNQSGTEEKIYTVCNGWYMHQPRNWPPAENLHPLFISFHAKHDANYQSPIVHPEHISYFKKFEPIGCRDLGTLEVFKRAGIDAWFSGCLTLTLENKFTYRNDSIYCVDPFANLPADLRKRCSELFFPRKMRERLIFRTHYYDYGDRNIHEKLNLAQQYVDDYARAKLVVTSRIHCALPCLALGTPVIFIDMGYNGFENRNRFGGLLPLMNTIDDTAYPFYKQSLMNGLLRRVSIDKILFNKKKAHIDWDDPIPNPVNVKLIADQLRERVQNFIHS